LYAIPNLLNIICRIWFYEISSKFDRLKTNKRYTCNITYSCVIYYKYKGGIFVVFPTNRLSNGYLIVEALDYSDLPCYTRYLWSKRVY